MLIGAISDTHDNLPQVEKAVKYLNDQKVGLVLHAGDYVAGFVIPKFKQLNCKLIGVFGNNDGDHELLKKRFSETSQLHNPRPIRRSNSGWLQNRSAAWRRNRTAQRYSKQRIL